LVVCIDQNFILLVFFLLNISRSFFVKKNKFQMILFELFLCVYRSFLLTFILINLQQLNLLKNNFSHIFHVQFLQEKFSIVFIKYCSLLVSVRLAINLRNFETWVTLTWTIYTHIRHDTKTSTRQCNYKYWYCSVFDTNTYLILKYT
jgi:hypothetical protein